MPSLFASDALLLHGWAHDVLLEWDDAGMLRRVAPDASAGDASHAAGPVVAGMPNVHSHAFQRAMAGLAERRGHPTDDFWTWREAMYALVRRLQPEDVEAIATHLYIEMLMHGYTSVAEFHYLHHDPEGQPYADPAELAERIVAAARASGIALTLLPVLYRFGGFGGRALDAAQRRFASSPETVAGLLATLKRRHGSERLLRLGVAPHSVRAVDAPSLARVLEAADGVDATMPVHMHVSEQPREVTECVEEHGATPFAWIRQNVSVDERWCLIHATHLSSEEARAVAKCGAVVGLCPTTEANLGDGLFDLSRWITLGGAWGIGGDSHVSVSPFEELRWLECGQRLRLGVRNVAASDAAPDVASNLWRAAAGGGARALGQPVGAIAPGLRADLVVLDGTCAELEALDGAGGLAMSVFAGNSNRVRDVFVAGRHVVRDGHHEGRAAAAEAMRAALRRLRGGRP